LSGLEYEGDAKKSSMQLAWTFEAKDRFRG